ncbi:MAG: FAD-dependent oxidoreductase [Lachnospiraceae bacterium]|jgi:fumarate reductase flavoprotein subunit|nr:FAD-dependent oxidoreductase [Lachnospiraceae bacterium]
MAHIIEQSKCSGCHQCKSFCPVGAIRFKNRKYWIDPDKCIDCGTCVAHCHNGIISDPAAPPQSAPAHARQVISCDLLVIGAGGSGLTAAVRAQTQSKGKLRIVVIDKAKEIGGSTWYAHGYRTLYSRFHKESGVPDTRYEEVGRFLEATHWDLDPKLVYNVFMASDAHNDWLIDECGCKDNFYMGEDPMPWGGKGVSFVNPDFNAFPRPDTTIGPGEMGSWMVLLMKQMCAKLGIEIVTRTQARSLTKGADGRITGALATDPGGEIEYKAKAVVLATGCFSHNEEYLRIANPDIFLEGEPVHFFAPPCCTGDGIRMAEEAGADIDYDQMRALTLGPSHHPYGMAGVLITREPESVFVDIHGRRYASETNFMSHNHLTNKLPGLISYAVCDSHIAKLCVDRMVAQNRDGADGVAALKNYLEEIAEETAIGEATWQADTLEELAGKMGVPADAFTQEIGRYNQMCREGRDLDFFKQAEFMVPIEKPPFYGFYQKRFQENAMGGCKIDSETRVLGKDGKPIPGLYAVGDNTRGVQIKGDVGMELVERTISAFTWCVLSGFIAGTTLAGELPASA